DAAALRAQDEIHIYRGDDLDRLAIEQGWLIAPLAHGFHRARNEQRVTREHLQLLHRPVLSYDRLEAHHSLNASLPRQCRIDRFGLADQTGLLNLAANADASGGGLWRGRQAGTHTTDYATEHAASLAARHSARHTSCNADRAHIRRHLLLFNDIDFLWDGSRGRQLSRLDQPGKLTDRKSTRLNSSHGSIAYAVFCLKKKRAHRTGDAAYSLSALQ